MKPRIAVAVAAVLALVAGSPVPAGAADPRYDHLNPGGQPRLAEKVPVNIVFVGYEPAQVRRSTFLAGLPRRYEPVVRSRLPY